MLCDGRVVCGCADPYGHRVLGDAPPRLGRATCGTGRSSARLRDDLNRRRLEVLRRLPAEASAQEGRRRRSGRSMRGRFRARMFIECTAACNISCTDACCAPETGITRTRQAGMLDFDLFRRVIDEAGPSLGRIDFFNYGEAFLHKRAIEMCEYIKTTLSAHLPLHEHQRAGVLRGAGPAPGALGDRRGDVFHRRRHARRATRKYRQRGRFDVALVESQGDGRRKAARRAATCRSSTGATSCSSGTTATRR